VTTAKTIALGDSPENVASVAPFERLPSQVIRRPDRP